VRAADLKGYSYSREDVDARSLANQYASIVGNVFTHELKPLEVEILVAEVGAESDGDQLFHITFDGTVVDDDSYSVLGGEADAIAGRMEEHWSAGAALAAALQACVTALAGPDRTLTPAELEVAVLERGNGRRTFRRLDDDQVEQLLGAPASGSAS
jgi:proteasome alpha subunit